MSRKRNRPPRSATSPPAAAASPPSPASARIPGIDALRGSALCMMFVYHFCFDLRYFRVIAANFENDPFWLGFRALIVASFMLLVGVSLAVAVEAQQTAARFWRRIALVAGCAAAASVGSYLVFPATYIYFGILHSIAAASVLARPLARRPALALGVGTAIVVAGLTLAHPAFDQRWLSWIGFATHKPATEDYVPLAPWAGFVGIGIAAGHALLRTRFRTLAPLAEAPRWLRLLGRHSLVVYMVHQPVLMGILWIAFGR